MTSVLHFSQMPFCIGACGTPSNPDGLPDTYPFSLDLDRKLGLLRLKASEDLTNLLDRSYGLGVEMGTPLADSPLGLAYVEDFISTIIAGSPVPGLALEIGAGVGYVSHQLKQLGWSVDSLEPGVGYEEHWQKYDIDVIQDFFPSEKAKGPYDLIVSYAVLEHMSDPVGFLNSVSEYLTESGVLIIAVPDCTDEIRDADPAMLIHEHYSYFSQSSLRRCLSVAGFDAKISKAGHGRLLYATARCGESDHEPIDNNEKSLLEAYLVNCSKQSSVLKQKALRAIERGELGIYCPARALAVLPQDKAMRFFDDAEYLQGKYYPPFSARIESRDDLFDKPPEELWIMSRTFGEVLRERIEAYLPNTSIFLIDELME